MKRFLTICLMILALMAVTMNAPAETPLWKEAAEQVAQLESRHGYYEKWKMKPKVELIRILSQAGEISGDDVDKVLNGKMKDKKRSKLCDKIMKEYVGGSIDLVCLESIVWGLHGQNWSMEDKVWYQEMQKRNGLSVDSSSGYALPHEGELSEKEAVDRGRSFLLSVGCQQVNQAKRVDATFTEEPEDWYSDGKLITAKGTRSWSIIFEPDPEKDPNYSTICTIDISSSGEILGYHAPGMEYMYMQGRLPDAGSCPEDMALATGKKAISEALGIPESELAGTRIYFGEIHAKDESLSHCKYGEHVWAVHCEPNYYALLSPGGQLIYAGKHRIRVNGEWQDP